MIRNLGLSIFADQKYCEPSTQEIKSSYIAINQYESYSLSEFILYFMLNKFDHSFLEKNKQGKGILEEVKNKIKHLSIKKKQTSTQNIHKTYAFQKHTIIKHYLLRNIIVIKDEKERESLMQNLFSFYERNIRVLGNLTNIDKLTEYILNTLKTLKNINLEEYRC